MSARAADRSLCAAANFEDLRRRSCDADVGGDGCRKRRTEYSIPTARHVVNSIMYVQTVTQPLEWHG